MDKKKFLILGIFVVIFSLCFVLAAYIIIPESGATSFSVNETANYTYNISIGNTFDDANISQVNITLPSNFTFTAGTEGTNSTNGPVSIFSNTSTVLNWTNTTTHLINASQNVSFWFNATASYPGTYNFTINITNTTGFATENISVTVNDTTDPIPTLGTNPINYLNSSTASITFDMKCSDNYALSAIELWGNWSGTWVVNETNATTLINNTYWNKTLTLTEGHYKWGIYCNDSTNNSITSNRTLTVDVTAPTVGFSCTPSNVVVGEVVTCACSTSDDTSGINSSASTSSTSTPSTASTGAFTGSCSATDYAGNTASSSSTYVVSSPGGYLPGGSSSTSTWTQTHVLNNEQFTKGFSKQISEKHRFKITINSQTHHIGLSKLTASTATIEVASTPQQAVLNIGDLRKFEVTGDTYYDVSVKLNSIESNNANFTILSIHEPVTDETTKEEEEKQDEATSTKEKEDTNKETNLLWLWILLGVIALVVLFLVFEKSKKRK